MANYQDGYVEGPDTSNWPRNPKNYPASVGSNYQGEDPSGGWIYDPYTDQYYRNQQKTDEYYQNTGIAQPKPKKPGIVDTLLPIGAAAGAFALGSGFVKDPKGFATGIKDAVTAPFSGWGGEAATAAQPVAAQAAPGVASAGQAAAAGAAPAAPSIVGAGHVAAPAAPTLLSGAPVGATGSGWLGATGAPTGALGSAAAIGAGAATGYEQIQGIKNIATGHKPSLLEGAALFPVDFGASLAASVFGWGHSKNYYDGKNREKLLENVGPLNAPTQDGKTYSVTPKQFRKDPSTFNYDQSSPTMQEDIGAAQALAFLKTGKEPGKKGFNDLAGLFANAHKSGVATQDLYGQYGEDYNSARNKIQSSDISQQIKDTLINGLDQSFHVNAYANGAKPVTSAGPVGNSGAQIPQGVPSQPQQQVQKSAGPQRISPGVYQDAKGTYKSKTGERGK